MINIVLFFIFVFLSVYVCYSDIKRMELPLYLIYIGLVTSFLINIFFSRSTIINHLLGMICMSFYFEFIRLICHKNLGLGDVQYALYCGFISGFPGFIFTTLTAALLGLILFLFYKIRNKQIKKVPFAPFMCVGTLVGWCIKYIFIDPYFNLN